MSTLAGPAPEMPERLTESFAELRGRLQDLLSMLIEQGCGIAMDKVQSMADRLEEMAARGGPQPAALLGALSAKLTGSSPLLGAVSSVFSVLSPGVKAAVVLGLVLAAVLLPVTVLLVLLVLIVGACVLWARSST